MNDPINPYAAPKSNTLVEPASADGLRLASRGNRLVAIMLDGLIASLIFMPFMFLSGYWQRTMERAQRGISWSPEVLVWGVIGTAVMIAVNWTYLDRGQTIGKSIMKLRIVRKDGSPADRNRIIFKRLLPIQLIAQIPTLGGFVALVDALCIFRSQRNTLHDDIADTKVVDLRTDLPTA